MLHHQSTALTSCKPRFRSTWPKNCAAEIQSSSTTSLGPGSTIGPVSLNSRAAADTQMTSRWYLGYWKARRVASIKPFTGKEEISIESKIPGQASINIWIVGSKEPYQPPSKNQG